MKGSLQEKNNKYYIVIDCYVEGKRKQKWVKTGLEVKGNKRKAQVLLDDYLRNNTEDDIKAQILGTKEMLFGDYMLVWLESMKNSLKANTHHEYSKVVKRDIVPYFNDLKVTISELNNMHIQTYYNHLMQRMTANSALKRHANIHKALKFAVQSQLLTSNPADYIILPKKDDFEGKYFNSKQLNKLFVVSKEYPIEAAVKLAGYYGLRRSEVLGLRWNDINMDEGTILIKNTVVSIGGHAYEKEKTKNKKSKRTLPLEDGMKSYLKQLKIKQLENKIFFGSAYVDNDFICKWENGQPFKPDYVTNTFKRILDENKLPQIRFHDLRHSSASLLLKKGFELKEIQEWLGHSTITTTSNIYAHLQYEAKVKMVNKVGKNLVVNG